MKKVAFKVNGQIHEVLANKQDVLLDFLREELDLTGAKQSCDRKGQCGACTVIVNHKAVNSCLTKLKNLDGAEVVTVEGLGTPDNPHLIQHAFVLAGAVQCGFCTPGMIMAAKALLDSNPDPDDEAIKKALRRNLCRCTGYVKIIEAVHLAGRFVRGETSPEQVAPQPSDDNMGVSHARPSALAKACGVARFSADYNIPGALELAVVRSELPHAEIKGIDFSEAEGMPGVEGVLTAADIQGSNMIKDTVSDRQVLCSQRVRCIGDPIAVVAAHTRAEAVAAAQKVKVDLGTAAGAQDPGASHGRGRLPATRPVAQPLLPSAPAQGRRRGGPGRFGGDDRGPLHHPNKPPSPPGARSQRGLLGKRRR